MKDLPEVWIARGFTCREVAARANLILKDRLSAFPTAKVLLHLGSCASCRRCGGQLRLVRDCLRGLPAPSIPVAARRRLVH